jgi:hypothetical protein
MWVTECNVWVKWTDEKTKEPSEADLRVQGGARGEDLCDVAV